GHDALMSLAKWLSRWGQDDEADGVRRRIVEHLVEIADKAPPLQGPHLLQRALQASLDFGIADLGESCRLRLAEAIRSAAPHFTGVSGTFKVPPELIAQVDTLVRDSSSIAGAIRGLAVLPGLLELDMPVIRELARDQ